MAMKLNAMVEFFVKADVAHAAALFNFLTRGGADGDVLESCDSKLIELLVCVGILKATDDGKQFCLGTRICRDLALQLKCVNDAMFLPRPSLSLLRMKLADSLLSAVIMSASNWPHAALRKRSVPGQAAQCVPYERAYHVCLEMVLLQFGRSVVVQSELPVTMDGHRGYLDILVRNGDDDVHIVEIICHANIGSAGDYDRKSHSLRHHIERQDRYGC